MSAIKERLSSDGNKTELDIAPQIRLDYTRLDKTRIEDKKEIENADTLSNDNLNIKENKKSAMEDESMSHFR